MRLLVALNVDSWPQIRIVSIEVGEGSAGNTMGQVGLTPDVTYIGDIWRESKLLLTSIWSYSFGSLSLQFRAFRTGLTQSISQSYSDFTSLSSRTKPEYHIVTHIFDSNLKCDWDKLTSLGLPR